MVLAMLLGGLRRCEVLGLRLADVSAWAELLFPAWILALSVDILAAGRQGLPAPPRYATRSVRWCIPSPAGQLWPAGFDCRGGKVTMGYDVGLEASRSAPGDAGRTRGTG